MADKDETNTDLTGSPPRKKRPLDLKSFFGNTVRKSNGDANGCTSSSGKQGACPNVSSHGAAKTTMSLLELESDNQTSRLIS